MDNSDNQPKRDSWLRDASSAGLASMLIHAVRRLTGDEPARRLDAGTGDMKLVIECVNEIAARYRHDPSIAKEGALRPVVEALRRVKDIDNIADLVQALKDVEAPSEVAARPIKPNPFRLSPNDHAPDEAGQSEGHIGEKLLDGTVYAGISPGTGREMYTTLKDESKTYTFNDAAEYVRTLNSDKYLGHSDWRVPSSDELHLLWENRDIGALAKSFNGSAQKWMGWHWSSTELDEDLARAERFSNVGHGWFSKRSDFWLRCVRG